MSLFSCFALTSEGVIHLHMCTLPCHLKLTMSTLLDPENKILIVQLTKWRDHIWLVMSVRLYIYMAPYN